MIFPQKSGDTVLAVDDRELGDLLLQDVLQDDALAKSHELTFRIRRPQRSPAAAAAPTATWPSEMAV